MRRKTKKALKLSANHAAIALHLLIEDGRIAAADVTKALKNREKMIRDLRARLEALEKAAAPVARRIAKAGRKAARRAAPKARKAISRAQATARRAQGTTCPPFAASRSKRASGSRPSASSPALPRPSRRRRS